MITFVAIIPGPNEPHTTQMNHVLRPLVDELKILQQGVKIAGLKVRVKVMNWACDLPALRKTLGWLSHNANKVLSYQTAILNLIHILLPISAIHELNFS